MVIIELGFVQRGTNARDAVRSGGNYIIIIKVAVGLIAAVAAAAAAVVVMVGESGIFI